MLLALVSLLVACVLVVRVSTRAMQGELPRNHTAGLRTPTTMTDDETWQVGNEVAGPWGVRGGSVTFVLTLGLTVLWFTGASQAFVGVGVVAASLVLAGFVLVGAMRGNAAAAEVLTAREPG